MAEAKIIEVTPEGWWQVVLVGMQLPKDHPSIQTKPRMPKGEKYEGPIGAWRTPRVGAKGMKAMAFDNAMRAGQREVTEARPRQRPGQLLASWEIDCRTALRERELTLCLWLASFAEVPYIVRAARHDWYLEFPLIKAITALSVMPECWEYDDDALDRVPTPKYERVMHALTGVAA